MLRYNSGEFNSELNVMSSDGRLAKLELCVASVKGIRKHSLLIVVSCCGRDKAGLGGSFYNNLYLILYDFI